MATSAQCRFDSLSIRLVTAVLAGVLLCAAASAGAESTPQAGTPESPQSVSIAGISPKFAPAIPPGGIAFPTEVTITGEGFRPEATVILGSKSASIVSVSPTRIRVTVPGQAAGTMDVTVTNPEGTSATQPKAFTYTTGPIIYGITPPAGNAATTTAVRVAGGNLNRDCVVTFGGLQAQIDTLFSATLLEVQVPANPAVTAGSKRVVEVTVKNADGQTFMLPNAFTWTGSESVVPSAEPTS
jgi:hypothetical protein